MIYYHFQFIQYGTCYEILGNDLFKKGRVSHIAIIFHCPRHSMIFLFVTFVKSPVHLKGYFPIFAVYVSYSTLLHQPPLRIHCVGEC